MLPPLQRPLVWKRRMGLGELPGVRLGAWGGTALVRVVCSRQLPLPGRLRRHQLRAPARPAPRPAPPVARTVPLSGIEGGAMVPAEAGVAEVGGAVQCR